MLQYITIFGSTFSSYSLMAACGALAVILSALLTVRRYHLDSARLFILIGYAVLGAVVGAKLLYILVSFDSIQWDRLGELSYLVSLLSGGFVFYGGLILALVLFFAAGRIHKIDAFQYMHKLAFAIPLGHAFGRVGCFLEGCCYGIPYQGPFAVVYPENGVTPAGIPLFPVQLAEALCLLILALVLWLLIRRGVECALEIYMIAYGVIRFCMELLRYDAYRGIYAGLSTSQWISIALLAAGVVLLVMSRKGLFTKERTERYMRIR